MVRCLVDLQRLALQTQDERNSKDALRFYLSALVFATLYTEQTNNPRGRVHGLCTLYSVYHLCTISLLSFPFLSFSLAHNEKHFFEKNDYDTSTGIKKMYGAPYHLIVCHAKAVPDSVVTFHSHRDIRAHIS
mgnify:CR=1 FL=1